MGYSRTIFFLKGFQPPLLNVKPRSQFDMTYKIVKRFENFKLMVKIINFV